MSGEEYIDKMEKITYAVRKKLKCKLCKGLEPQVSIPGLHVLAFLSVEGPCSVTDIANNSEVTLSAVTSIVDKLVKQQLVKRVRSQKDRRTVKIHLEDKGKEILKVVRKNAESLLGQCFSHFTKEEIETYFKITDRLALCITSEDEECKQGS